MLTIAPANNTNGHSDSRLPAEIVDQLLELDRDCYERRRDREAESTYAAGTVDRMNPMAQGIDPVGTDADYHYRTEFNYFLMVERARTAVLAFDAATQPVAVRPVAGPTQIFSSTSSDFRRGPRLG